jgi:hypothetical protein
LVLKIIWSSEYEKLLHNVSFEFQRKETNTYLNYTYKYDCPHTENHSRTCEKLSKRETKGVSSVLFLL